MARYKINRSNYTVKRRHQLIKDGVVFERDFMTTTNLGGWDSGSIPYGENNFRMVHRNVENARKRPHLGSWLIPVCSGDTGSTNVYWTVGCVEKTGVTEEKTIKIKPNYNSLLDFAYYGSCQELVKSTIKKIIDGFPGEAYVDTSERYNVGNGSVYLVQNNFDIDFFDTKKETGIRDFVNNYEKYVLVDGGTEYAISSKPTVTYPSKEACKHGDFMASVSISAEGIGITLNRYLYDTKPLVFTGSGAGWHIRPSKEYAEEFFDGLDDFGKVLLDRTSEPIYTAVLDRPYDTDSGVKTYKRSFTWPLDGEWNIDIRTTKYENYVESLLSLAAFYDDGYTDNLWRMLTHDSVKSMDLAFSNPAKDEDQDDYNIGATRLEGLLWAYGRQFDDLKRAIDNIKHNTNVTYDENGNMPDYFLSDSLELSGWEVYSPDLKLDTTGVTVAWLEGVSREYTAEEAGYTFLRNLKLNSKEILKKKGTRDGIISLLGLFGMQCKDMVPEGSDNWDFSMEEHVAVVNGNIEKQDSDASFILEEINGMKSGMETSAEDRAYNPFDGLPFTYVANDSKKYIIPWFCDDLKYDGNLYFQMYGGWCKKDILKTIFDGEEYSFGGSEYTYDETLKYLIVVDTLKDLFNLPAGRTYDGVMCYVEDITGLEDYDGMEIADTGSVVTHYFVLQDKERYDRIGGDGWVIANVRDAARIEAIVDDFRANNPHVGYGKYDSGQEFLERIKKPFKWHIENDTPENPQFNDAAYECNGSLKSTIETYHVSLEENVKDDGKVWFFGNTLLTGGTTGLSSIGYETFDFEDEAYSMNATEASANSIINVKTIDFLFRTEFVEEFREYFEAVILPYLKQMIPSTAIWSYLIQARDVISTRIEDKAASPIALKVDAVAYEGNGDDINDDYIANYVETHNSRSWNN